MPVIDLRSDTVTQPCPAMREAMASAEVGDDVYGEDPTLRRLEALAAERTGKEAALFVPSGTMANQVAIRSLTRPGDIVLVGRGAHLREFEVGAPWALWGLQVETIGSDGFFEPRDIEAQLHPPDLHRTAVGAISIENSHNLAGGRVWPLDRLDAVLHTAREHGIPTHLDGARLFNASCALGVEARRIAEGFDRVSFCLSKGLGAPVGSLACADRDAVEEMRRVRKQLGGGMRQAGVLAAAGIHALEHHVQDLERDHRNARRLAEGMQSLGFTLPEPPQSNIVLIHCDEPQRLAGAFAEREVLMLALGPRLLRAVVHRDVRDEDVDDALARIAGAVDEVKRPAPTA